MSYAPGWASFPANQAKITIDINGSPHPVLTLDGTETVSEGFRFVVTLLTDQYAPLNSFVGATTKMAFHGQDGIARTVIGVVTRMNELGHKDDSTLRVELTVESNLAKLNYTTDTRVILGRSVPDLILQTCKRNGLLTDQLQFDLSHEYPVNPLTTQAAETDWAFISRLATREGIYFYSIVKDDREVIVFTDHNARCPYIAREVLNYIAPSGANETVMGQALVGVHHLGANVRMGIPQSRVHDYNENTPSTNLLASTAIEPTASIRPTPQPGETVFGLGTRTLDETDRRSRLIAERAAVEAFDLTAHGNVVDMAAGHICSLDASHFSDEYSADYFITTVTHKASQFAGHDEGDEDIAYRHEATCIRRETPYRSKTWPHPETPMTMTARIESGGRYAHLDEQGRSVVRALFDLSTTKHTQATTPMRRLSPYGGQPNESNVGFHTPLHDGDEVLISCLNGDPDRPMIVGTVPNPDRVSPVTSANSSVNRLRTQSDNELTFDDTQQKEAVTLRTYEGYNILHLDATELANKVRLASEHGAMVTFAKKTIHRQSDDTMTERVGNDRLVKVKNKSVTETQNKEIQHQAKTDHEHAAHNNLKLDAAENIELQSGRHTIIDVEDNVKITIKGADGQFTTVRNGDVTIQSAKSIDITGQGGGDITFEQNGGGFKIDTAGVVSFYGKKIFFGGAGGVQLNGKVNYSVPGPNPPGPVSTTGPMAFAGIDGLIDPADPEIIHLSWSQKRAAVGQTVELRYTLVNVKPGDTATIDIFEIDSDGTQEKVDTLTQSIDDGHGHYTQNWSRKADDADQDIVSDMDKGEKNPLEYRFEVSTPSVKSELSPSLEIADTLEWKPVIEGFRRYAVSMTEENYLAWMQYVFENEDNAIPLDAYRKLYKTLQSEQSSLVPTTYVIGKKHFKGGKNPKGGYIKDKRFVLISRELVDEASTDNKKAFLLYTVLLEELGHHLDNVLRNDYSSVGGESKWDEGAMFAFSMLQCKLDGVHDLRFAKFIQGDARDQLGKRLAIKGWAFSKERIMADNKGWITMPSGERQYMSFFDASESTMCKPGGIEQPCGGTHKTIEKVLKKVGPYFNSDLVIDRIYFGNWLRDYSQLNDDAALLQLGKLIAEVPPGTDKKYTALIKQYDESLENAKQKLAQAKTPKEKQAAERQYLKVEAAREKANQKHNNSVLKPSIDVARAFVLDLVDLLAIKEFRDPENYFLDVAEDKSLLTRIDTFRVTLKRLQGYQAPEHIDNPRTGDPLADLKFKQDLEINPATWQKRYVGKSIKYVEEQLGKAAKAGPSDEGMRHFGAALHTLEDYFAHTNYSELKSLRVNTGNPGLNTFIKENVRTYTAKVKIGNKKIYPIVTGTFTRLDMIMSLTAKLVKFLPGDESADDLLNSHSISSRIILLYLRRQNTLWSNTMANFYEMLLYSKNFFKKYMPYLYNKIVAEIKAVSKFLRRRAMDMAQETVLEMFIAALKKQMVKEGISFEAYKKDKNKNRFENQWAEIDKLIATYKAKTKNGDKKKILEAFFTKDPNNDNTSILRKRVYDIKGEVAIKQVYMLGKTYQDFVMPEDSTDPTHTQIAKDYYVQPLHGLAINLAEHAVLDVGKQIYEIWFRQWDIGVAEYRKHMQKALKQPNFNTLKTLESLVIGFKESFKPLPPTVYAKLEKTLLKTARDYMQHPALENSTWSNKIVLDWWKKNAKGFKYPPPDKIMHGH